LLNKEKVCSHITNDILQEHSDVSKVIVCVDSECTPPQEIEKEVRKVEKNITSEVKHSVHYVVVVHALEGWLLAGPESIREYLGARVKVNIPPSATLECKPKKVMSGIFSQSGKEFLYTRDNPRITERIHPDEIARRNPSFGKFMDRIRNPDAWYS